MKIRIGKNVSWQKYQDAVYVIDESNEFLHKVELAGVYLWEILLNTNDEKEIIKKMMLLFETTEEELCKELNLFIDDLIKGNIVEVEYD